MVLVRGRSLPAFQGLYLLNDVANGFEGLDVGQPELYSKLAFHGYDEVDVHHRVPTRNLLPDGLWCKHKRLVSQQDSKNARQRVEDVLISNSLAPGA